MPPAFTGVTVKPGVLVVEDDPKTAELIRLYLDRDGYPVMVARNGREGLEFARRHPIGVVLLDVMLPEMDGFDVCRLLRAESDMGIILVTARTEEVDTLRALDLGADDYVTKPFRPRELVARVRAVLRRKGVNGEPGEARILEFRDLVIDERRHEVRLANRDTGVTKKEFQLLVTLAGEPGKAFSRLELVEKAFGFNYEGLERTVDAHIRNLRKKIERDPARPMYIETVYGLGYRFAEHLNGH
ncbi:MAG: response regulator transcription factor [Dehalococcoidia bacterium]